MTGHHNVTRPEFEKVVQDIKRLDRNISQARHEHTAWNRRLDRIADNLVGLRADMARFQNWKTWATGCAAAAGTAIAYAIISLLHQGFHP